MFSGKIMPISINASKLVLQKGLDGSKCHQDEYLTVEDLEVIGQSKGVKTHREVITQKTDGSQKLIID